MGQSLLPAARGLSSGRLRVSSSGSDQLVLLCSRALSFLPAAAPPGAGGGGAPLPEVLSEGTGLPSQFPPSFCSQNDERPGSLSSSLFASTPKLWPSVFICECVTQQGQDVCLSLLSDWLTSRSLQRMWRLVPPKTRTSPQVGGLRGRW